MNKTKNYIFWLVMALLIFACKKLMDPITPNEPKEHELLDGPIEGLSFNEMRQFIAGDIAFNDEIFTAETGLGPYFVATSCGTCHPGDGKGHPFSTLTRFGQSDSTGNKFLHLGGPQLQNRALPGYSPEQIPAGATSSKFIPPANTGLGYLEALTDAQILANADPFDLDGDGISGRPNYIDPPEYFYPQAHHQPKNGKYIGRFGRKASTVNLLHQTVSAYSQDMGITSDYDFNEPAINGLPYPYFDNVPDPEIGNSTINNVVFYLRTLKAPIQRDQNNQEVLEGKSLFMAINCGKCHTPEFTTPVNKIAGLSNKTFYPYTDMLLHDMGSGLDDGYTEGIAQTSEWRTPTLWGLGLAKDAQGGRIYLMHDGRAKSINEAITMHGGEAENSKNAYANLSEMEKKKLIRFLESL
jgi:CxxC motif-containing protein (DUF1111 family)